MFIDTTEEAYEKTAGEIFAWVLVNSHYYAVFRTPAPKPTSHSPDAEPPELWLSSFDEPKEEAQTVRRRGKPGEHSL